MTVEELRDAIERRDNPAKYGTETYWLDRLILDDAARSFLRVLEEGREVWWCAEHDALQNREYPTGKWCNWADESPCRMVRMVLTPKE